MKKGLLLAGVTLIISLAAIPAYAVWDEEMQMQEPVELEVADTLLENVIIEMEDPPMVDLGFPRIKGFKTTIGEIRSRLRLLDLRTNVSVTMVEVQACVAADRDVPEYFMFDTPYIFQEKQSSTVCSDPISLYIE
jgi:hypothetical protein